jgi:ribosomal protein L11 methyltransferase
MDLDSLDPAIVEDIFIRLGASSVTLSDAGDDPVLEPGPGETPLWSNTRITGLFPGNADMDVFRESLLRELGVAALPDYRVEDLADRAWEREWLKDFGAMRFGERLWICPSGNNVDADGAVVVHLDPGLAFGTGTHPTTALCLEWLDGIDLTGKARLWLRLGNPRHRSPEAGRSIGHGHGHRPTGRYCHSPECRRQQRCRKPARVRQP